MFSFTRTALQMPGNFLVFCLHKNTKLKIKLVYLPLLVVNSIGFLQYQCTSVKILYFHQVSEQKNSKQKCYAKSFKIVQILAWHLGCCSTFVKRKNTLACGSSFLRFPKISQHPTCMDHAILHGKPLSNPLILFMSK